MKIWKTVEDVLADFEADRPKPKPLPKPPLNPTQKAEERWSNQPTQAVIDAATRGNVALAKRISSVGRVQLTDWQQSVLDVQRAVVRRGKGARR
jgi:hypothetical protein